MNDGKIKPYSADKIYTDNAIEFEALKHLDDIGLITFSELAGFTLGDFEKETIVLYCGYPIVLSFPKDSGNRLEIGKVLFTKTGAELARVCKAPAVKGFFTYMIDHWSKKGLCPYTLLFDGEGNRIRLPHLE